MKADNTNNFGYQKNLRPLANALRKDMTKSEACLWKFVLRAGSMKGYTFRRQRPVINYIADFMSIELKLIIEVDGITHNFEESMEKDTIRQNELENAGFTVIRFMDDEILNNIENVQRAIEVTIKGIENRENLHPPTPRQRGTFVTSVADKSIGAGDLKLEFEQIKKRVEEKEEELDDEMYEKALSIVGLTGYASTSMIQGKLKIGYNRAARMLEKMEEEGIVGPPDGSKPREILVDIKELKR
ncbi:MAG: DUF559 domain-containing protein [Candidatus Desantisbacteria bacterium]